MRRSKQVDMVLAKLESSGYRCALTGWKITPQCFELDHIVSMNDGGGDDVSNLQCVHPLANRAKGTMGNQQFIDLCAAVTRWQTSGPESLEELTSEVRRIGLAIDQGRL